ncbi:MAG TPA: DUF3306 domain-containing protein [Burkholderiales bacterium]
MAQDKEPFLSRWSRLKQEKPVEKDDNPVAPQADAAPPELPPVESLTPDSDFRSFMHPKVADALRRVALKKLFSDPHFNVADPYEAYSGDWTVGEPLSEEMLASLKQARSVLFREEDEEKKRLAEQEKLEQEKIAESEETKPADEPGRKDT